MNDLFGCEASAKESEYNPVVDLFVKLGINIIKAPKNPKYRSMKVKSIKKIMDNIPGAMKILAKCGFTRNGEKLVLEENAALGPLVQVLRRIYRKYPERR